jgi:hypothetical protein
MKNYLVSDYNDWKALSADLTAELTENLVGHVYAIHKTLGPCEISGITISINESNLIFLADCIFGPQTKKLAINVLLANKLIEIAEPNGTVLSDFISACTELQKEVHEITLDRNEVKAEESRKAAEEAKQEAKYQAAKEKAIQEFEVMTRKDKSVSATGEFYYNLGWLAKNVGTVSAALPDYLLKYFENHFGTEANPTVVDSRKRTVNGYPIQWALSMKASVPKKVVDSIPAFLKQYLNPTGNALTNTTFIWDIVENYGFQFGRKQDLEKIRATIPATCLEQFEKGFAL